MQPDPKSNVRISEADHIDTQRFPEFLGIFVHVPERGAGLLPGLYFSPLGVMPTQWQDEDAHEFRQSVTNYVNTAVSNQKPQVLGGLSGDISSQFRLEVANPYDPDSHEDPQSVLLRLVPEEPETVGDRIAAGIIARRGVNSLADPWSGSNN